MGVCPECGKEHNRGKTNRCPACYQKAYRKTEKGKVITKRGNDRYIKSHPDKRAGFVIRYCEKYGQYIPYELHELRAANKYLERVISATGNNTTVRIPSKYRRDQALKRRDRLGCSASILESGENSCTDGISGSAAS